MVRLSSNLLEGGTNDTTLKIALASPPHVHLFRKSQILGYHSGHKHWGRHQHHHPASVPLWRFEERWGGIFLLFTVVGAIAVGHGQMGVQAEKEKNEERKEERSWWVVRVSLWGGFRRPCCNQNMDRPLPNHHADVSLYVVMYVGYSKKGSQGQQGRRIIGPTTLQTKLHPTAKKNKKQKNKKKDFLGIFVVLWLFVLCFFFVFFFIASFFLFASFFRLYACLFCLLCMMEGIRTIREALNGRPPAT